MTTDHRQPTTRRASGATYYDRRDDPNDIKYLEYSTKLDASGSRLETDDTIVSYTRASDPMQYTYPGVGEYQDVWNWYGKWFASYVFIPDPATGGSGQGDIYLSRIAP